MKANFCAFNSWALTKNFNFSSFFLSYLVLFCEFSVFWSLRFLDMSNWKGWFNQPLVKPLINRNRLLEGRLLWQIVDELNISRLYKTERTYGLCCERDQMPVSHMNMTYCQQLQLLSTVCHQNSYLARTWSNQIWNWPHSSYSVCWGPKRYGFFPCIQKKEHCNFL